MTFLEHLRLRRAQLDAIREINGGVDPTHRHMRARFRTWRELRREERARNREAMHAMRRVADPRRGTVVQAMPASTRRDRMVPKGGPRNLWRTFPPQYGADE